MPDFLHDSQRVRESMTTARSSSSLERAESGESNVTDESGYVSDRSSCTEPFKTQLEDQHMSVESRCSSTENSTNLGKGEQSPVFYFENECVGTRDANSNTLSNCPFHKANKHQETVSNCQMSQPICNSTTNIKSGTEDNDLQIIEDIGSTEDSKLEQMPGFHGSEVCSGDTGSGRAPAAIMVNAPGNSPCRTDALLAFQQSDVEAVQEQSYSASSDNIPNGSGCEIEIKTNMINVISTTNSENDTASPEGAIANCSVRNEFDKRCKDQCSQNLHSYPDGRGNLYSMDLLIQKTKVIAELDALKFRNGIIWPNCKKENKNPKRKWKSLSDLSQSDLSKASNCVQRGQVWTAEKPKHALDKTGYQCVNNEAYCQASTYQEEPLGLRPNNCDRESTRSKRLQVARAECTDRPTGNMHVSFVKYFALLKKCLETSDARKILDKFYEKGFISDDQHSEIERSFATRPLRWALNSLLKVVLIPCEDLEVIDFFMQILESFQDETGDKFYEPVLDLLKANVTADDKAGFLYVMSDKRAEQSPKQLLSTQLEFGKLERDMGVFESSWQSIADSLFSNFSLTLLDHNDLCNCASERASGLLLTKVKHCPRLTVEMFKQLLQECKISLVDKRVQQDGPEVMRVLWGQIKEDEVVVEAMKDEHVEPEGIYRGSIVLELRPLSDDAIDKIVADCESGKVQDMIEYMYNHETIVEILGEGDVCLLLKVYLRGGESLSGQKRILLHLSEKSCDKTEVEDLVVSAESPCTVLDDNADLLKEELDSREVLKVLQTNKLLNKPEEVKTKMRKVLSRSERMEILLDSITNKKKGFDVLLGYIRSENLIYVLENLKIRKFTGEVKFTLQKKVPSLDDGRDKGRKTGETGPKDGKQSSNDDITIESNTSAANGFFDSTSFEGLETQAPSVRRRRNNLSKNKQAQDLAEHSSMDSRETTNSDKIILEKYTEAGSRYGFLEKLSHQILPQNVSDVIVKLDEQCISCSSTLLRDIVEGETNLFVSRPSGFNIHPSYHSCHRLTGDIMTRILPWQRKFKLEIHEEDCNHQRFTEEMLMLLLGNIGLLEGLRAFELCCGESESNSTENELICHAVIICLSYLLDRKVNQAYQILVQETDSHCLLCFLLSSNNLCKRAIQFLTQLLGNRKSSFDSNQVVSFRCEHGLYQVRLGQTITELTFSTSFVHGNKTLYSPLHVSIHLIHPRGYHQGMPSRGIGCIVKTKLPMVYKSLLDRNAAEANNIQILNWDFANIVTSTLGKKAKHLLALASCLEMSSMFEIILEKDIFSPALKLLSECYEMPELKQPDCHGLISSLLNTPRLQVLELNAVNCIPIHVRPCCTMFFTLAKECTISFPKSITFHEHYQWILKVFGCEFTTIRSAKAKHEGLCDSLAFKSCLQFCSSHEFSSLKEHSTVLQYLHSVVNNSQGPWQESMTLNILGYHHLLNNRWKKAHEFFQRSILPMKGKIKKLSEEDQTQQSRSNAVINVSPGVLTLRILSS